MQPNLPDEPQSSRRWLPNLSKQTLLFLIILEVLIIVAMIVYWQASRTLSTVQQVDPRPARPVIATAQPTTTNPDAVAPTPADPQNPGVVPTPQPTIAPLPPSLARPFTVLLIGVDQRPDTPDDARGDTLIVVRVDPIQKWASMLSIPRDSVAVIPGYGQAKINAAYATGYRDAEAIYGRGVPRDAGASALAASTVEQFIGVPVDYTAQVNFRGFQELIDALGGVLIDVERPILDASYPTEDYGIERLYIAPGPQVMNGKQALAYARSRHASSDFDRSKRQQRVLQSVLEELKVRGVLENVGLAGPLIAVAERNIRTTLPIGDLASLAGLAGLAREIQRDQIAQYSVNPNDVGVDAEAGSDLYWNRADLQRLVQRWLRGPEGQEDATIQVLNGSGVPGTAGTISETLRNQGFTVIAPANASQVQAKTVLIDYRGMPQTRQRLAQLLGLSADQIEVRTTPDPSGVDIQVIAGEDALQ